MASFSPDQLMADRLMQMRLKLLQMKMTSANNNADSNRKKTRRTKLIYSDSDQEEQEVDDFDDEEEGRGGYGYGLAPVAPRSRQASNNNVPDAHTSHHHHSHTHSNHKSSLSKIKDGSLSKKSVRIIHDADSSARSRSDETQRSSHPSSEKSTHSSRAHSPIHTIENDKHYLKDPSYRHHDEIKSHQDDRHHHHQQQQHHHHRGHREVSSSPQPHYNSTSRRATAAGGLALVSNDMEDMLRNVTMQNFQLQQMILQNNLLAQVNSSKSAKQDSDKSARQETSTQTVIMQPPVPPPGAAPNNMGGNYWNNDPMGYNNGYPGVGGGGAGMMRRNYYADYDGTRGYQPQPPYGYRPSNLLGHTGGNPYVGPNNIPLNDYELARRATNLRPNRMATLGRGGALANRNQGFLINRYRRRKKLKAAMFAVLFIVSVKARLGKPFWAKSIKKTARKKLSRNDIAKAENEIVDILKEDSHFHSAIMDIATASKDGVIFLDKENQFQKSRTVEAYFRRIILNLLSAVENISFEEVVKKFGSDSNAVRVLYTIVTHYTSLPPSFQNKSFSAEAGKPINNADQPDSPAETGPDLATQISQAKQENVSQVTEEVDDESKAAMASSIIYFIVIRVLMVKMLLKPVEAKLISKTNVTALKNFKVMTQFIYFIVFNPSLSLSARPSKLSTTFCPELEVAMSLVDLQILGGNDASLFGQRRGSVSEQSADASSSAFDKVFPKLYKQLESLVVESRRKMESWTETIVEEITEIH